MRISLLLVLCATMSTMVVWTSNGMPTTVSEPYFEEEEGGGGGETEESSSFGRMASLLNNMRSMLRGNEDADDDVPPTSFVLRISSSVPIMRFRTATFGTDREEETMPSFFPVRPSPIADFFGPDSLFQRLNGIMDQHIQDMMSRIRQRSFMYPGEDESGEDESGEDESGEDNLYRLREIDDAPKFVATPTNQDLEDELEESRDRIDELEDLKVISDQGFLEADWGVNVANMRDACADTFEKVCPESIPVVFDGDIHRFPPTDVPHMGLAPKYADAPCWMKCAEVHQDELPYECQVAVERMENWISENGDDVVYVESPQWFLFTAMLHFLIIMLLITACVRCTCLFCKLRQRRARCRRAALLEKDENSLAVPIVKAITIQVPAREDMSEEKKAALLVSKAEVVA